MIRRHHVPSNAVSVPLYCRRCSKVTQHRADSGRAGPCLDCMARAEERVKAEVERAMQRSSEPTQGRFWDGK